MKKLFFSNYLYKLFEVTVLSVDYLLINNANKNDKYEKNICMFIAMQNADPPSINLFS